MLGPHGLRQRSFLLQAIRSFFLERAYLEVDTPLRLPVLLPESNIVPFNSEGCFLHTSPELCMKRLLARGCSQIFQICHCFRKEEHGRLHQSEFTMLEWYHTGWDYVDLMQECEELVCFVMNRGFSMFRGVHGSLLCWRDHRVAMTRPWDRLTVADAFDMFAGISVSEAIRTGMFDEILVTAIEPHLGKDRPVFLYDYPISLGSLARRSQRTPDVAERFELYVAGIELANGFSELIDPEEQRSRFAAEIDAIHSQGRTASMPENFLADLSRVPETAGIALGVDRLFMLLTERDILSAAMPFIFEEL
ncbi:lysyl-tRNA synthetase-related protein GenX [Desulfobulbus propionicus DSM 2032]|jgi:lysyl-tRNA synthetase class 2|uniref:Lysyl-tRNA synthetase-related protein GenX n=1 Tax=Desulfobulbus propionicus (strain ATCC 33891 / DSM 2032 / VKM B-1956 / 1pr3) TaxID=577650 RepID=A0A7U4DQ29_DESPD|nr:EF-P lysine aminoacylase EpmA [Desulfobulbus propionicus]ADW18781.1 lysyl-tRNA synthetase-related protein GenX [Desulfobulbus propionicus DSM 2032]